jgi:vancomycin resistance protein VanW
MATRRSFLILGGLALAAPALALSGKHSEEEHRLAEFRTSLSGRSPAQRHNARWAVQRLNGATIATGKILSFNTKVGPWTRNEGVQRAPVSYGGILVPSWGGGVCQVSTTLYCAALLAGLTVVERASHEVAPAYIPAGMDAAVAFQIADLKVRNPFADPVKVHAEISGDQLICRVTSPKLAITEYQLARELVSSQLPATIEGAHRQPGRTGVRVRLWRISSQNGTSHRELCQETEYAALPHSL